MATKTYKNYTQDADGLAAMIADIKEITSWAAATDGSTSTIFSTSNGGDMTVSLAGSSLMVLVYRAGDGKTMFQAMGVRSVCFIKTTKAVMLVFNTNTSTSDDWLYEDPESVYHTAVVISHAINTVDNSVCADQMSALRLNDHKIGVLNTDYSAVGSNSLTQAQFELKPKTAVTLAMGLCSSQSAWISTSAFAMMTSTRDDWTDAAVTIGGKKYYEVRQLLLADDDD